MRWAVAEIFENLLKSELNNALKIGIVGGSENDPEVKIIALHSHDVTYLGIEPVKEFRFQYFDLNVQNNFGAKYDLVICSQVLEHIFDVKQGIENLMQITKEGGRIWINCPYSNHSHGSPEFYSSGYAPALIEKLARKHGAQVLFSSQIGSKRQYFFTHTLRFWPNKTQYLYPLLPTVSRFYLRKFMWFFIAAFLSSKVSSDEAHATETMVLLRKPQEKGLLE
jgi:SAM-dependent methyltransferase